MRQSVFEITNGREKVNLFDPETTVVAIGGAKGAAVPIGETASIGEEWTFHIRGNDVDHAADQLQRLTRLLRQANEFRESSVWSEPVYIRQQASNEANDRKALIREVTEIDLPDVFGAPIRQASVIEDISITLIREHPWRSGVPGQHPDPLTLVGLHGPDGTVQHVGNFRDDGDITHVYWRDDSLGVWSPVNLKTAPAGTALWPAVPAANDAHYIGSTDIAFKHAIYGLQTPADIVWDTKLQFWNGAAWTDMTLGTEYTLNRLHGGELLTDDEFFEGALTTTFAINLFPALMTGWAKTIVDAVNAYWIRILIVAVTSTAQLPLKNGDDIYALRSNYIEVAAVDIRGDTWPIGCQRLWAPSGALAVPSQASISRVLIGAKSDFEDERATLDDFEPMLNLGNQDNPPAWSVTYDTDSSAVADVAYPGGFKCRVTFASDSTLLVRAELIGSQVLLGYRGEYRVFLGFQQIGGAAGDVSVTARVFVGEDEDWDPHTDLDLYDSLSHDLGIEVADLGLIQLPRSRVYASDPNDDIDVAIHVLAERVGGSAAQLDLAWVYLFPVAEGSVGADDPVTDSNRGSSALRGGSYLEIDNGIVANRTVKFQHHANDRVSPSEEWARFDRPIEFRNLLHRTRLYFLFLHYTSEGWGVEPLIASPGTAVAVEAFMHYRYIFLRGDD